MRSCPDSKLPLVIALTLMSAGCGQAADGGGGAADGGGATCVVPACLDEVAHACLPTGICRNEAASGSTTSCYANGVTIRKQVETDGSTVVTVTKADGKTDCWSIEQRLDATAAPSLALVFRNGAGAQIATGSRDDQGKQLTITCDGRAAQTPDWECRGLTDGLVGWRADEIFRCTLSSCR
jgi:hypothetical protein